MTKKRTADPAADPADPVKTEPLVEVTLAKPHTHQRARRQIGETIFVTPRVRDFLTSKGVIDAKPQEA
ncbi:hypothetical protein D9M68_303610 [compost metagenome]